AVTEAFEAYGQARAAGSPISAVAYLAAAARYGASMQAAAELDSWGHHFESPISDARATGVRARATGDAAVLLKPAERHAALGLLGDAAELAGLALAACSTVRSETASGAKALGDEMRRRLRQVVTTSSPVVPLTRRELEVASLAARGMTDQDIAGTL